jgi:hypothetical protein
VEAHETTGKETNKRAVEEAGTPGRPAGPADGSDAAHPRTADFLAGGGEMGGLMRSIDWSQTTAGPLSNEIVSGPKSLAHAE